jgi:hypothetical protein
MENFRFIFETSPLWLIPGALLAALYAFLLYGRQSLIKQPLSWFLAFVRAALVLLLIFILINPLLRTVFNTSEQMEYLLVIDNSASVKEAQQGKDTTKVLELVAALKTELDAKNVKMRIITFNGEVADATQIAYSHPGSNIDLLLRSALEKTDGKAVAGVLLVSDGIVNQGVNPAYRQYSQRISTFGVGDTLERRDARIAAVFHNKVSFLGNKFPIQAEIEASGMSGQAAEVMLKEGETILERKSIRLSGAGVPLQVNFMVEAKQKGMRKYTLELKTGVQELTLKNNVRSVYIEIMEGKERILIVAPSPHPDIKAIRAALEREENFEVLLYIPGMHALERKPYSLIILHQVPDVMMSSALQDVEKWINEGTPAWFFVGTLSNIARLSQINSSLSIVPRGNYDNVTGYFNDAFALFNFEQEQRNRFRSMPPLAVPFGDYALKGQSEVVLYQAVGSARTTKPLLVIGTMPEKKSAVWVGEGLWTWRLQEYTDHEDTKAFDNLISKTVQYLSTKDDKRKFRLNPVKNEVFEGEKVIFEGETYNSIFERVYQKKINLSIQGDNGKKYSYEFINSETNSLFEVPGMPAGLYKYTARTELDGKEESISGEITVKVADLESQRLTADHLLLRELAEKNGGTFYDNTEWLLNDIKQKEFPAILRSTEDYKDVINLRWLFFVLLALLTVEWGARKWKGEL